MLYSNCCNAPDRIIRKVLDMHFSEQGICPNCLEHCDFSNPDIIEQLSNLHGDGMIVSSIRNWIVSGFSHMDIFQFVKDQSQTNIEEMHQAIGIELTNKILAL